MRAILVPFLLAALSPVALAQTLDYRVELIGGQEVPANNSGGIGEATVTVDTTTGAVRVSGRYSNLTSNAVAAHIHGFARRGANAGVIVGLNVSGGQSGTFSGSGTLDSAQLTGLLEGLTYLNLHTMMFPPGELRGQIDTVPGSGSTGAAAPTITGAATGGGTLQIGCPPSINPASIVVGLALPPGTTTPLPPAIACSTPTGIGLDVTSPFLTVPGSSLTANIPANAGSVEFAVQCIFVAAGPCVDLSAASRIAVRP